MQHRKKEEEDSTISIPTFFLLLQIEFAPSSSSALPPVKKAEFSLTPPGEGGRGRKEDQNVFPGF